MNKINKKSINLGFKTLAVLAFGLLMIPGVASAERIGYVTPYNDTSFNDDVNTAGNRPYESPTPVYTPTVYTTFSVATVYSSSVNPNRTTTTTTKAKTTTTTDNTSSLAANALYGSNGFLPSGLLQWILLAIFILLITILARKVFGARKRYDESPLKHA